MWVELASSSNGMYGAAKLEVLGKLSSAAVLNNTALTYSHLLFQTQLYK